MGGLRESVVESRPVEYSPYVYRFSNFISRKTIEILLLLFFFIFFLERDSPCPAPWDIEFKRGRLFRWNWINRRMVRLIFASDFSIVFHCFNLLTLWRTFKTRVLQAVLRYSILQATCYRAVGREGRGKKVRDAGWGIHWSGSNSTVFAALHEIRDCRLPSHWTTSNSPIFASLRSLRAHLPSVFLPRFMNPPSIAAEFRNRICIHRDQPPLLNHRSSPDSRCN